jgi:PAS domain S-box-containing protein
MDKRIHKINKLLTEYSLGKFERRLELSHHMDDIDAFINGVNMLGEELKDRTIRRDYFVNILNSVSDIVLVLNRFGKVEEINRSGCEQLECERDFAIGVGLDTWQEPGRASLFTLIQRQLGRGKPSVTKDSVFLNATGRKIPVHIFSTYLLDDMGKRIGFLVTAKDVTLQLQAENLLLRAIIDTQERERQRLAKDLHDSLGQQISAIKFYVSATAETTADLQSRRILTKCNEALMTILAEMRNICFNLMPKTLEEFGLLKALEELATQVTAATGTRFVADFSDAFPSLDQRLEIDLFRVVQEFINNAIRHGQATRIWIRFHAYRNHVRMVLKDNGRGFDPGEGQFFPGTGLQNVQSRIKSHNGEVKILSASGAGTQYRITIPINH